MRGSTIVFRPTWVIRAGAPRRHLAHDLRQRTLGQGVGFDPVLAGHGGDRGRVDQRAANDTLQQPVMREMAEPAFCTIAESDRVHGGEGAGTAVGAEAAAKGGDQSIRHRMPRRRNRR